jgi:hypothetical protein
MRRPSLDFAAVMIVSVSMGLIKVGMNDGQRAAMIISIMKMEKWRCHQCNQHCDNARVRPKSLHSVEDSTASLLRNSPQR